MHNSALFVCKHIKWVVIFARSPMSSYRLIIFRKSLLFTLLTKNLNKNSTRQHYCVEKSVKLFKKKCTKRTFWKLITCRKKFVIFHRWYIYWWSSLCYAGALIHWSRDPLPFFLGSSFRFLIVIISCLTAPNVRYFRFASLSSKVSEA